MQKDIVLSYIILYYTVYAPSYTISYIYFVYTVYSLNNSFLIYEYTLGGFKKHNFFVWISIQAIPIPFWYIDNHVQFQTRFYIFDF